MIRNGGAEYGSAEGWSGLETNGEIGLRRGVGRSGEYGFIWRGQSSGIESDLIEIDTGTTYELKGWFKADMSGFAKASPDALPSVLFGVLMYDAQKRHICSWHVFPDKATWTELSAACESGAKTLKVKNASAWKPGPNVCAAFGKKENEPNFDVTPLGIVEIKQEGDHWKIVLKEPCAQAFPAGTPMVENRAGGNGIFLPGGAGTNEWKEFKATIGPKQWWPGTKYVLIYIQPQRAGKEGLLFMDDLTLRVTSVSP